MEKNNELWRTQAWVGTRISHLAVVILDKAPNILELTFSFSFKLWVFFFFLFSTFKKISLLYLQYYRCPHYPPPLGFYPAPGLLYPIICVHR